MPLKLDLALQVVRRRGPLPAQNVAVGAELVWLLRGGGVGQPSVTDTLPIHFPSSEQAVGAELVQLLLREGGVDQSLHCRCSVMLAPCGDRPLGIAICTQRRTALGAR